jgi:hypothetical protein
MKGPDLANELNELKRMGTAFASIRFDSLHSLATLPFPAVP